MHRLVLTAVVFLSACNKGTQAPPPQPGQAPPGLPPASAQGGVGGGGTRSAAPADPHADPHAGMGMGDMPNPHAGVDMGNPHAGVDMGGSAPPPAAVDPSLVLEGTIEAAPALKDQVKAGDILFLSVKSIDAATGEPVRFPIAVDRLDVSALPMPFKLTPANSMMAGTKFEGPVVVSARIDRDGEARSRAAGDIEGVIKATIPQKGLKLVLDTPVK